jgi:hypothetical protein
MIVNLCSLCGFVPTVRMGGADPMRPRGWLIQCSCATDNRYVWDWHKRDAVSDWNAMNQQIPSLFDARGRG